MTVAAPYKIMFSGRKVSLVDPRPEQISIRDIAHHLALINRFDGATRVPYSVNEHSCHVSDLCLRHGGPRLALFGLIHDAPEMVIGDITRPVKLAISGEIDVIKRRVGKVIRARIGIDSPLVAEELDVAFFDNTMLAAEIRDLIPHWGEDYPYSPAPISVEKPWHWTRAEEQFLTRFDKLTLALGLPGVAALEAEAA